MKHFISLTLLTFLSASALTAQDIPCGSDRKDEVLLDFPGREKVMRSDFEYIYAKNNGGCEKAKNSTTKQYGEYLQLYVKFKRKIYEAEDMDLDKAQDFEEELENYRKQLAAPYLKRGERMEDLETKFPEFRHLLREYRDGILVFTVTEMKVWRRAVEDEVGLRNYFDAHPDEFRYDERIICTEYVSSEKSQIERIENILWSGGDSAAVSVYMTMENPQGLKMRTQTYEKKKSPDEAPIFSQSPGFHTSVLAYGKFWRLLVLREKLPAKVMTFEEAKGLCTTKYQEQLETEWVAALTKKYPVKIKMDALERVYR